MKIAYYVYDNSNNFLFELEVEIKESGCYNKLLLTYIKIVKNGKVVIFPDLLNCSLNYNEDNIRSFLNKLKCSYLRGSSYIIHNIDNLEINNIFFNENVSNLIIKKKDIPNVIC